MKLLRIDCGARHTGSHSRELGDVFEQVWRTRYPHATLVARDLAADPVPHIHNETIAAMFAPPGQRSNDMAEALNLSDTLVAEVREADALLLTVPMYNFGVPSSLKAWIDHVSRIGETFSYDGTTFAGLLGGRSA